ncbi:MAG: lytic murein transglycosylase, partial [Patescibacteria group bacterium]
EKLDKEKDSLSQILRKSNEMDSFSLPEIILSGQSFSEFFADVTPFTRLKEELQESFAEITDTRTATEVAKTALEDQRSEEMELRKIQTLQKHKLDEEEKKKQDILKASKGEESRYQKILEQTQQSATAIRAALFNLQGTEAIPFDKAYQYAKEVESRLGVRAAFLLGIIAEESNLGKNVGTGNWRKDMKAPRDTEPFLDITRRLGLDPDKMLVSKKPYYGWGGAMGPAQFIPSTWVLYEDRIASLSGHNPPNPWNAYDSFIAAGILLKDNGAGKGTRAAERLAALRYLAGWKNATKVAYAFYGDEVMELADYYQQQINILEGK